MNHQPFKNWLLSEEDLSVEQAQSLQEHLASCESCSQVQASWNEMEFIIQHTPQVSPAAGFTQRWEQRLAQQQALEQDRKGWFSITATAIIAVVLSTFFIIQVWELIRSPNPFLMTWLNQLMSLVADYYILQNMLRVHSWWNIGYLLLGMFFLVGIISFMSVLWATAYQKFSLARRIV